MQIGAYVFFFFLLRRFDGCCDDDAEPTADEKLANEDFGPSESIGDIMGDDRCEYCGASDGTGRAIWNTPLLVV